MRVLGIDPGTSRWSFVIMDEGRVVEETSVPAKKIRGSPQVAVSYAKKADLTVAPSGYGTLLKRVDDLEEKDFFEILLKRDDEATVMGLEAALRAMGREDLNAYVIPGVKLLPTVPKEKKQDKIDMGTPDKLCAAVAGILDQSRKLKIPYNETSFILAEIGYGFDAFIAVKGGQIVDGIGGTMSSSTWRGKDGEILYLQGKVSKGDLKKGDVSEDKVCEGALKDIKKLCEGFIPREILVSGNKTPVAFDFLKKNFKDVRKLETCNTSNAAFGAAVIADGLIGGKFKEITGLIQIKDAKGSNLDYVEL